MYGPSIDRLSSKKFGIPFLFFLLISSSLLNAQDTILLQPVNIVSERIDIFSNSINILKTDSFQLANAQSQNMAEVLGKSSGIQIRSYGFGGVSMLSMRNGNSYQSALLWNGFNLQDPLNGGINLSLLPAFFFDKIEIHKGGETSLFGSGAMGGSVLINSTAVLNRGLQLNGYFSSGSFDDYQGGICVGISKKKWASNIKIFHRQAENDFPFINNYKLNSPVDFQKNAAFRQNGISQQNSFSIGKKNLISLDLWYLNANNETPATMAQTASLLSNSLTNNARSAFSYSYIDKSFKAKFRSAVLFNSLKYNDLTSNTGYLHNSLSQINEVEFDYKFLENQQILVGFNNTNEKGLSESLLSDESRIRNSVFFAWKIELLKKIALISNLRKEFVINYNIPLTYSFRANYRFSQLVQLFASYTKNYRLPTFNDLYWTDYFSKGNPELKPEFGTSSEIGFTYSGKLKAADWAFKANYFHSDMNDLIQWVSMAGIWSPDNYEQVISNGLELSADYNYYPLQKLTISFHSDYSWLSSILKRSFNSSDILGNQMIFVPRHKMNSYLRMIYNNMFSEYKAYYTGMIYTTTDQSDFLTGFLLQDFSCGYNFTINNSKLTLSLKLMNIFNVQYQLMPGYAMPGVHYELNLKYSFRKPSN